MSSFPETLWSQIRPGPAASAHSSKKAFEALAASYWGPVNAWLTRALSRPAPDADDLTQDFFAWVLETGFLGKADPSRGRFRTFLKVALRNYVTDHDRRQAAAKRGGDRISVPLSTGCGSGVDVAADGLTPEAALDAAWRAELLARAVADVEAELGAEGRGVTFAVFKDYFLDPQEDVDYDALATKHGITRTNVSNHLMRAKRLFRKALETRVRETILGAEDLETEIRWLLEETG